MTFGDSRKRYPLLMFIVDCFNGGGNNNDSAARILICHSYHTDMSFVSSCFMSTMPPIHEFVHLMTRMLVALIALDAGAPGSFESTGFQS